MNGSEFRNKRSALHKSREQVAADFECSFDTIRNYETERSSIPGVAKYYFMYHGIN